MKVALLTWVGVWGGTEAHTIQLTTALERRGHDATIVCLTERAHEEYQRRCMNGVKVIRLKVPQGQPDATLRDWLALFAEQPWDACLLVKGGFGIGGWGLDLAARYRFRNYMTIEHLTGDPVQVRTSSRYFGFLPGLGLWWYRARLQTFLRSLGPRKIICVSEAVRRRLVNDYHFAPGKIQTIRNGTDVQRFRPNSEHATEWRKKWAMPDDAVVFGALGRFATMKGYDVAVRCFRELVARHPERDFRLVLVGEGEEEQALRNLARGLPDDRVVFAPFCDRPWEALCALDVFLMPSRNEGLPLTLLEAMACGCCPVATAIAGIPEVLTDPSVGWLVPGGDEAAFLVAMDEALSKSADERTTMGRLAREHVVRNFNAAVQFDQIVDAIEGVVG